ncbi:MAG: hypothetical protein WC846_00540 [Candidatus Gracilibacteria bacterium]|jgi:hypothetical protein
MDERPENTPHLTLVVDNTPGAMVRTQTSGSRNVMLTLIEDDSNSQTEPPQTTPTENLLAYLASTFPDKSREELLDVIQRAGIKEPLSGNSLAALYDKIILTIDPHHFDKGPA